MFHAFPIGALSLLLGTNPSLPSAPAAPAAPKSSSFELFGLNVCVGAVPRGVPCDVRLFEPGNSTTATLASTTPVHRPGTAASPGTGPRKLTMWGKTLCFDERTITDPGCALRIVLPRQAKPRASRGS